MLIILEGIDGSGKTTIANRLNRILPRCIYIKNGAVPYSSADEKTLNALKFNYDSLIELFKECNRLNLNVIMDRFFISELVYSKVKRGYEASKDPYYAELELRLMELYFGPPHVSGCVIHINTPLAVVQDRLRDRGDDFVLDSDLIELNSRYDAFFANCRVPLIQAPGTDEGFQQILEKLSFGNFS